MKENNKKILPNSKAETDYSYMTDPIEISPELVDSANKQFSDEEVESMRELMDKINDIFSQKFQ